MKRVLIFSLQYHPYIGGAEVAIKEITDRIPSEEIEFHMVTLRYDSSLPRIEQVGNILVHRIGLATRRPTISDLGRFPLHLIKHLYQFYAAYVAMRLHNKYRYDAVWAMMAHSTGIPAGIFKTFHPHVPYLLTLQEGDPPAHVERLARPVWPLFVRGFTTADRVQAISTSLLSWARRMGFQGDGVVIPNGVAIEQFTHAFTDAQLAETRTQLGKREGDVFLVTTSRLVHKNGIDTVIQALQKLPERVSFLVYGIGPEEDELRALAIACGVAPRVHFMGHADHNELSRVLSVCDIFIRPSRSEGMGNSFLEAMAVGLPVIATQVGGIADFLFDATRDPKAQTTGWAVDVDAPEQIAAHVETILTHPDQVRVVCEQAQTMVREQYDWNMLAVRMQALLVELATVSHSMATHILIATPLYPPDPGGPATYAKLLKEHLPDAGIKVSLVSFSTVKRYPKILRHALYLMLLLRAGRRVDLIYALDPVSVGVPATLAAWLLRKPFALKVVGDYAWEQGRQRFGVTEQLDQFVHAQNLPFEVRQFQRIESWVARRASCVVVPSEYLKHIVMTWEGIDQIRIKVIYNALQEEGEASLVPDITMFPRPRIVSIGRLVPWKHVDGVIDAIENVSDASLIIVGEGPSRKSLEQRAQEKAPNRVLFTGALPHAETLAVMRDADLLVLNSTYEGLSHLLIEALALGVPTIATRVGGNSELINHEENGLLIPARDTNALTAAIERTLSDRVLRERLSTNAKVSAQRFSAHAMIEKTVALLNSIV